MGATTSAEILGQAHRALARGREGRGGSGQGQSFFPMRAKTVFLTLTWPGPGPGQTPSQWTWLSSASRWPSLSDAPLDARMPGCKEHAVGRPRADVPTDPRTCEGERTDRWTAEETQRAAPSPPQGSRDQMSLVALSPVIRQLCYKTNNPQNKELQRNKKNPGPTSQVSLGAERGGIRGPGGAAGRGDTVGAAPRSAVPRFLLSPSRLPSQTQVLDGALCCPSCCPHFSRCKCRARLPPAWHCLPGDSADGRLTSPSVK